MLTMTTPAQALETAQVFVAQQRQGTHIQHLLEDASDYFVQLELDPGMEWRVGEAFLFVSKATGKLHEEPPSPDLFDRLDRMATVQPS